MILFSSNHENFHFPSILGMWGEKRVKREKREEKIRRRINIVIHFYESFNSNLEFLWLIRTFEFRSQSKCA